MAIPQWTFVLTDLSGTVLGEVTNADDRQVVLPLNRVPTAAFKVPLQHTLASYIMDTDTRLKCYRDGVLRFHGPVISAEETGDALSQSISVAAAGAAWILGMRLVGKSKSGWAYGTAGTTYDKCYIASQALALVNTDFTGITAGTIGTSTNTSVGPYWYKPCLEIIAEMSSSVNAFDWEVAPTEPTSTGPGLQIGLFNCSNLIGTAKNDAIFEYGTTKANVVEYKRQVTRDKLLTRGYILAPGWPSGTTQDALVSSDATAITARGWYEDVVADGGVTWDTLRQQLVDEHVRVRKQARQTIYFTPAPNASPAPFTDYIVGDQVRARAVVNDIARFDAMFRVWGITFNLDKNGNERVELELITP